MENSFKSVGFRCTKVQCKQLQGFVTCAVVSANFLLARQDLVVVEILRRIKFCKHTRAVKTRRWTNLCPFSSPARGEPFPKSKAQSCRSRQNSPGFFCEIPPPPLPRADRPDGTAPPLVRKTTRRKWGAPRSLGPERKLPDCRTGSGQATGLRFAGHFVTPLPGAMSPPPPANHPFCGRRDVWSGAEAIPAARDQFFSKWLWAIRSC